MSNPKLRRGSQSADLWDWPLQHTPDGLTRAKSLKEKFEVDLDMQTFGSDDVQIKVAGHDLHILCDQDGDKRSRRMLQRTYHLPDDVDTASLKGDMNKQGKLVIAARKKPVMDVRAPSLHVFAVV